MYNDVVSIYMDGRYTVQSRRPPIPPRATWARLGCLVGYDIPVFMGFKKRSPYSVHNRQREREENVWLESDVTIAVHSVLG